MIKARKLFLIPSLSALLLIIPFLGIPLYIIVCIAWYLRNKNNIHLYFQGINYDQNEIKDKELEKLK